MLVAGNIVGWGGPKSPPFSNATPTTYFDEQMMDFIAQGSGEELIELAPNELRVAIGRYLDKGPNFVKYGGTSHTNNLITFSPREQEALVDEVHKRGLIAETHSTNPEPLRISVPAGIDLIQHPEVHNVPIPDDLVKLIVDRKVIRSGRPAYRGAMRFCLRPPGAEGTIVRLLSQSAQCRAAGSVQSPEVESGTSQVLSAPAPWTGANTFR